MSDNVEDIIMDEEEVRAFHAWKDEKAEQDLIKEEVAQARAIFKKYKINQVCRSCGVEETRAAHRGQRGGAEARPYNPYKPYSRGQGARGRGGRGRASYLHLQL